MDSLRSGRWWARVSLGLAVLAGIDGESVHLSAPVRCTIRPNALRVRLPRERPGVRPPQGRLDWASLWALAVGRSTSVTAVAETVTR